MIIKIDPSIVPYDSITRELCRTPYYGHSNGCPNYAKKDGCPPQKLVKEEFDYDRELYVIFSRFPIGEFAERMRMLHPEWKESTYPDHPKKTSSFVSRVVEILKESHPDWPDEYYPQEISEGWTSSRQWYNPRRWQGSARKEHKTELNLLLDEKPGLAIDRCPEAKGVNLTGLMHELGVELRWQWPPVHDIKNESYIISIAGYPKS